MEFHMPPVPDNVTDMLPALRDSLLRAREERGDITEDRLEILTELTRWIVEKQAQGQNAQITFICTHNSRRSQIAMLWAQAAAYWNALSHVSCHSGGTEVTAFNPRAVRSMIQAGFDIVVAKQADNPRYQVRFADNAPPLLVFSKLYKHPANPLRDFCAVMTCSDADNGCPFVHGAIKRISLPFDDPKAADDRPDETAVYDACTSEIAREMLFVMDSAAGNTQ